MLRVPEFKLVGYIPDLPERKKTPETYTGFLKGKMSDIANSVNKEFSCDLLGEGAEMLMFDNQRLEADKNKVSKCEEFYAREQKQTLEDWQKNKDKSRSTIAEMAITLVLHRLLGNRFIVARASKFDDYTHGIDNILIDKETGSIVCGFDDVLGYNGDDGGDKKSKKVNESLLRGGSFLDYGATIENGKVLRKGFRNIPTFFVSISKDELNIILSDLEKNTESTENEKRLISKIVNSLEKQKKEADSMAIMTSLRNNLNNFTKSLEVIKKYLNE